MLASGRFIVTTITYVLVCVLSLPLAIIGQTQTPAREQGDVVRVFTEIVQTDVMVFDKDGRFQNDLRREDFELRIDGKVRPIEFFERITAGTASEEAQLAAARGAATTIKNTGPLPLDRGRVVLFYVDDFHLDLAAADATRKVISRFIDGEMGQNDEAAVTSASGNIGFLQQLTENKLVLQRALARIVPHTYNVTDSQRPPMSEFQALRIDGFDRDVTDFYVDALLRESPGMTRPTAEALVQSRANQVLRQAAHITRNSLSGLETLVRSVSNLPGRKVLFFLSSGFFVHDRNSDVRERLQKITGIAARNGVVIYSMDVRGLTGGTIDASTDAAFDPSFRLRRSESAEITAGQDGLHALAYDTGGRTFFNTNDLRPGLKRALDESAVYYLLAWKPDPERSTSSKFRRIEVKLLNKPGLTARVRRGFFDLEPQAEGNNSKKPATAEKPGSKLWEVIGASVPNHGIPFSLALRYTNTAQQGALLSATMDVPIEFLTFTEIEGKKKCIVELAGAVYNEKGQPGAKLNQRLTITAPPPTSSAPTPKDFKYTFPVTLEPGLYQARFGVRDVASGRAGSVHAWIEIPIFAAGQIALSSLHLGERLPNAVSNDSISSASLVEDVTPSINQRFQSSSYLRFLVFVYNPAPGTDAKPDVALQVQLLRDGQPVITTPLKKVSVEGVSNLNRIPYAADVSLEGLAVGRYVLKVSVVDRVSKRSATQETQIEID